MKRSVETRHISPLRSSPPMQRPAGDTAIAIFLFMAASYLGTIGGIMLVSPGTISMAAGAPLLHGLELAGPYMFLLTSGAIAAVGLGLWRLHRWARRITILLGFVGLVMLIPSVSGSVAAANFGGLVRGGLGIVVRMVIIWYLFQTPVAEHFRK
jgi:hypothetical protein